MCEDRAEAARRIADVRLLYLIFLWKHLTGPSSVIFTGRGETCEIWSRSIEHTCLKTDFVSKRSKISESESSLCYGSMIARCSQQVWRKVRSTSAVDILDPKKEKTTLLNHQ